MFVAHDVTTSALKVPYPGILQVLVLLRFKKRL